MYPVQEGLAVAWILKVQDSGVIASTVVATMVVLNLNG